MLKYLCFGAAGAVGLTAAALASSCGSTEVTCEDLATCSRSTTGQDGGGGHEGGGSGGDGGAEANEASTDVEAAPGCSATKTPAEDVCVIDEHYGVFVSPKPAPDDADGSRAHPFASLATAFQAAKAGGGLRVYACDDGSGYSEQLVLDASIDGIALYGGFRCDDWTYSTARQATVNAPTPIAVKIQNLMVGFSVQDFAFTAADAATKGDSSIGVLISGSQHVRFSRVTITAGKAMDGDSAVGTIVAAGPGAPGNQGNSACESLQVVTPGTTMCAPAESSTGGTGGSGATASGIGQSGVPGSWTPSVATSGGGAGSGEGEFYSGTGWDCSSPQRGAGQVGASGSEGSVGLGAPSSATLDAAGWHVSRGTTGGNGHVGQGGGGGGGAKAPLVCGGDAASPTGASGGSGGAGGCGGIGGGGGGSGGSSVALASFNSDVTLDVCKLVATSGGIGGDGAPGQRGGVGGRGGDNGMGSGTARNACSGGKGGDGGNGGPGGGGAGGDSLGVAYVGMMPVITGTGGMITVGTPGAAGTDGNAQTTGPGAGAVGRSQTSVEIK